MKKRFILTLRIILLLLILPLLGIAFAPPIKTQAQCTGTSASSIKVENGLVSAIQDVNFDPVSNVNCVTGQQATIPQFSLQSYDQMKKDYFDQARTSFNKTPPINGNQTQASASSPINLSSL